MRRRQKYFGHYGQLSRKWSKARSRRHNRQLNTKTARKGQIQTVLN